MEDDIRRPLLQREPEAEEVSTGASHGREDSEEHEQEQPGAAADGGGDVLAAVAEDKSGSKPATLCDQDDDDDDSEEQKPGADGRHDLAAGRGDKSGGSNRASLSEEPGDSDEHAGEDGLDDSTVAGGGGSKPAAVSQKAHQSDSINSSGPPPPHVGDLKSGLAVASSTAAKMQVLRAMSQRFANSATGSSMASEALSFLAAVDEFDPRNHPRKIMETGLSKSGLLLHAAATRAPAPEAHLAAFAIEITSDSLDILLSLPAEDRASRFCGLWPCIQRLWAAMSGPEPTLPLHRVQQGQEKLTDRRQAVFGVALAAPLALLTSVAGVKNFPLALASWIAGFSIVLWIAVSCGLMMDLYGQTKLDFQVASCLSRFGMIGVTVIFCLFVFGAFFPSATIAVWLLVVAFAVALHTVSCVLSSTRGDDQSQTSTSNTEVDEEMTKCNRCGCICSCNLDV